MSAGIAIGAVLAVLVVGLAVFFYCRSRNNVVKRDSPAEIASPRHTPTQPQYGPPASSPPAQPRQSGHVAIPIDAPVPRSSATDPYIRAIQSDNHVRRQPNLVNSKLHRLRQLNDGEYYQVWLCEYLGMHLAVKGFFDKTRPDQEDIELFVSEIKLTASLQHPNIIGYRGVSWTSSASSLCMAMDYHAKGDLQRLLKKHGAQMVWESAHGKLNMALGIARALEYLHDRETPIIHRDVKAKNVLLSDKYESVLIDFGVSRDRDQESMTAGVGTPYWVAPELLKGTRYDERSDIYSFGVFLSELDTCEMPYYDAVDQRTGKALRPLQILQLVLKGSITPSFSGECPAGLLAIAERCLEHEAEKRPNATELVQLLRDQIVKDRSVAF